MVLTVFSTIDMLPVFYYRDHGLSLALHSYLYTTSSVYDSDYSYKEMTNMYLKHVYYNFIMTNTLSRFDQVIGHVCSGVHSLYYKACVVLCWRVFWYSKMCFFDILDDLNNIYPPALPSEQAKN